MNVNFIGKTLYKIVLLSLLLNHSVLAQEAQGSPSECANIPSSLERLACFDSYFKTSIHELNKVKKTMPRGFNHQPEILRLVHRVEKNRDPDNAGLLVQKMMDHEASDQERMILSAPAIGAYFPRPLLVISCINNITRFQVGFDKPLPNHSVRTTLSLDGMSIGGDYLWQVIESGKLVDAGRGIPSINLLKKISKYQRLKIQSDAQLLNELVFDISGLAQMLPEFRAACHW
jgi:type VI secretion system protein VasI